MIEIFFIFLATSCQNNKSEPSIEDVPACKTVWRWKIKSRKPSRRKKVLKKFQFSRDFAVIDTRRLTMTKYKKDHENK